VTKARETGSSLRHRFINRQSGNLRRCAYAAKASMHAVCIDQHNQSQSNENTDAELWRPWFSRLPTSAERTALVEKCVRELGFFPLTGFGSEK